MVSLLLFTLLAFSLGLASFATAWTYALSSRNPYVSVVVTLIIIAIVLVGLGSYCTRVLIIDINILTSP